MIGCKIMVVANVIAIISFQEVFAIKCWQCSSDETAFCNDPFDGSGDRSSFYVECNNSPAQLQPNAKHIIRAVCRKKKEMIDDKFVITRECSWEGVNASKNECLNQTTSPLVTTLFCETCTTDGCNGEAMS